MKLSLNGCYSMLQEVQPGEDPLRQRGPREADAAPRLQAALTDVSIAIHIGQSFRHGL